MHEYEIVYIFRSSRTSEEIESRLESFHARLTADGQISAVEHWGKRQLAYPIAKERTGYYVVAQFEAEPAALPEFERALKLDDDLLRYLIVLSEGELPVPPSMRRSSDERDARSAPGGPAESDDVSPAEEPAESESRVEPPAAADEVLAESPDEAAESSDEVTIAAESATPAEEVAASSDDSDDEERSV